MQHRFGLVQVGVHGFHLSDGEVWVGVGEEVFFGLLEVILHLIIKCQKGWKCDK